MPQIKTLIADIDTLLARVAKGEPVAVPADVAKTFAETVQQRIVSNLEEGRNRASRRGTKMIRMSEAGKPCVRQLWYKFHTPEKAEPLGSNTLIKFMIGDIVEAVVLLLVKLAGHKVTNEQKKHKIDIEGTDWTLEGSTDADVDDVPVDVKSASQYGYEKFKGGLTHDKDSFGYKTQLDAYATAGGAKDGDPAGFLVVQKQTGDLQFSPHTVENHDLQDFLRARVAALSNGEAPPEITGAAFESVPEGKSGNLKLPTSCSYCEFKATCRPGLRGFAYSNGPVFLTKVVKTPNVPEFNPGAHLENTAA